MQKATVKRVTTGTLSGVSDAQRQFSIPEQATGVGRIDRKKAGNPHNPNAGP